MNNVANGEDISSWVGMGDNVNRNDFSRKAKFISNKTEISYMILSHSLICTYT